MLDRQTRFRNAFVEHVHSLLARGYAELDATSYHEAEEEVITGELVRTMKEIVESPDAPTWMHNLEPQDEVPQSTGGRQGKRRKRIDIEFVRTQRGERPRFALEAKRLCNSHSVSEYLGDDGLGCFLSDAYATRQQIAGMLGYVQQREPAYWVERISAKLKEGHDEYQVLDDQHWQPTTIVPELVNTYQSGHYRSSPVSTISIVHTLLRFHD